MILLELVAQGVAGLAPSVRASLRTGYNVLIPANGANPALCDILGALLYSDGRGGDAALAAPGVKVARVGITFIAKDGKTYRLLRQLGGPGALHVLDGGQFRLISPDTMEVNQYVNANFGLPTRSQFNELYCFSPRFLPSRTPKQVAPAPRSATPSGPRVPASAAAALSITEEQVAPDEARSRIEELRKEAVTSKRVADLQFQLDGLNGKLFEAEEKLKSVKSLETDLSEAKRIAAESPSPEKLGLEPDILERARAFKDRTRIRDEALAKVESDKAALEESRAAPPPIWSDPTFQVAAALGVAAIIAGILFHDSAGRYLALFDIPALGFAAFLALQYITDVQAGSTSGRKLSRMDERVAKIQQQYESDIAAVKAAMSVAGVENPEELVEVFGRRATAEEKVRAAEAAIQEAKQDPDLVAARERRDKIQADMDKIEEELRQYGTGYVREVREIQGEIAKLEAAIAAAGRGETPSAGAVATSLGGSFQAESGPDGADDPCPRLLEHAGSILQMDVPGVGKALSDRITQYFYALSDQRYTRVQFDHRGLATLTAPGRTVPAGALPPVDLDLLFLSVKLALVERCAPVGKNPAILEDPFGRQADAKLGLVSRMLKHIGTQTQVILVTASPVHRSLADASAAI